MTMQYLQRDSEGLHVYLPPGECSEKAAMIAGWATGALPAIGMNG